MPESASISLGFAFLAGLASFLSPCVLPIVPGYITFVTGLTLDELAGGVAAAARRRAAIHAGLFILGFAAVFVALGATATAIGTLLLDSLPWLQRVGGAAILLFGLHLAGVVRLPPLARERRFRLATRPAGGLGSVAAGVAFGAGWTPCIGPVLASILLYAGLEATMFDGIALLTAYAIGLGLPFFASAVAFNAFLAGSQWIRRWRLAIQRAAGVALAGIGLMLVTGRFADLTRYLAGLGQLIDLEL